MANGRRNPHPLLRVRIVELNEALNEQGRQPDVSDIRRVAWILGELEKAGLLDTNQQTVAPGLFGQMGAALGISPTVLWVTAIAVALWIGQPFFDFLANFLPFVR